MVDVASLRTLQADAKAMAEDLGLAVRDLNDVELNRFGVTFERGFVFNYAERRIVDLFLAHQGEILLGAMVSKEQMDSVVDGEQPGSGRIGGPLPIRASFLGIGDDWEDIYGIYNTTQSSWSTGSAQNWIHSGTQLMAGTGGNAVRIGENAVHVIIGLGSKHPSPKIESCQVTLNGKTKPILIPSLVQKQPLSLLVKEIDNAYIWKKDDTVLAQIFISASLGAPSSLQQDYPYLFGASFIKEPQLRVFDPATLPGTTNDVIITT